MHISFVKRVIDNMTDNPPFNETPKGNSRFRTLTMYVFLQNATKLTDSSSRPDCGMDPHEVPHSTDMSHVNLWDKSVRLYEN